MGKQYYPKKGFSQLNTSCVGIKWSKVNFGALAQLARAFGWQPRGQGFDSLMLHFFEF
tara:strand:+ start:730 stop:903 length:174 start_codon:yes stop_codon:yes gene_type:complete